MSDWLAYSRRAFVSGHWRRSPLATRQFDSSNVVGSPGQQIYPPGRYRDGIGTGGDGTTSRQEATGLERDVTGAETGRDGMGTGGDGNGVGCDGTGRDGPRWDGMASRREATGTGWNCMLSCDEPGRSVGLSRFGSRRDNCELNAEHKKSPLTTGAYWRPLVIAGDRW